LRHLQRLDFAQMRMSIRERREWLRLAPELTRPLRFVLPTSRHGLRRAGILRAALWVNDLISADRNEAVRPDHFLPHGELLSRKQFDALFPGLCVTDCNAAAAWYDGVCLDTERLQLAVIEAAAACGAQVTNYMRALSPLRDKGKVSGLRARDELTGLRMDLPARMVINAAGPAVEEWLDLPPRRAPLFNASKAFNLLVRRLPFQDALGLMTSPAAGAGGNGGTYFIMPWNGYSLVGTRHLRCDHRTRSAAVSREEIMEFLAEVNPLLGEHRLRGEDVHGVFSGLLPEAAGARTSEVSLERMPLIRDHGEQGLRGLFSIVGVKWTTARAVGEQVALLACRRLGRVERTIRERALDTSAGLSTLETDPILTLRVVPDLSVVLGQVVYAVREQMAIHLWDVIRRRTPLYLSGALDRSALATCAAMMARELRWTWRRTAAEIETAEAELDLFRGPLRAASQPAAA
jgi:glycerol-3-phosphate dehydrogenase